jgi:hypothetical protein
MVFVTAFETLGLLLGPVLSGLVAGVEFSVGPVLMDPFSFPSLIAMGLAMVSAAGVVFYEKGPAKREKRQIEELEDEGHERQRVSRRPSVY